VIISGALLLDMPKNESLMDFYKKRFSRIFIPIMFWSLLYIVWGYHRENVQEDFTLSYVIQKIASGKPYYHLWFMYMLMGLYAFTPALRAVCAMLKAKELTFFIVLMFAIEAIQAYYEARYVGESNLFLTWFLTYLPFYMTGYLVRHYDVPLSTGKMALLVLAIAATTPVLTYTIATNMPEHAGYFYKNLNLMNILLAVSLMFLLKRFTKPMLGEKITGTVATLTFGIYLLHMIPLAYLHDLQEFWAMFSPFLYAPLFSLTVMIVTAIPVWLITKTPYLKRVV